MLQKQENRKCVQENLQQIMINRYKKHNILCQPVVCKMLKKFRMSNMIFLLLSRMDFDHEHDLRNEKTTGPASARKFAAKTLIHLLVESATFESIEFDISLLMYCGKFY